MWDLPAYRARAFLKARIPAKKAKEAREVARKRLKPTFRRLDIEIRVDPAFGSPSRVVKAWAIQGEFEAHGLKLFTDEPLLPGQRVAITIDDSDTFFARARVARCHEFRTAWAVISETAFRFRVVFDFELESLDEAATVAEYMKTA